MTESDKIIREFLECMMSGGFQAQAPEHLIGIVDPSGVLDKDKEIKTRILKSYPKSSI